jgi:hypothetical protein
MKDIYTYTKTKAITVFNIYQESLEEVTLKIKDKYKIIDFRPAKDGEKIYCGNGRCLTAIGDHAVDGPSLILEERKEDLFFEIYGERLEELIKNISSLPVKYKVIDFRPSRKGDVYLTSYGIVEMVNFDPTTKDESCNKRLILEEELA